MIQGKHNIDSVKEKFIDRLLLKLDERFPDTDSKVIHVYVFAVLGLRPFTFLSAKDI